MNQIQSNLSVDDSAEHLKKSLQEKGFTIFCDINHQSNAKDIDIEMPASRVIIFGNPMAGTKLMLEDINMSLDLPLRLALVEKDKKTYLIHQTSNDYTNNYNVANHPVLEKIEALFTALSTELQ
jgi:uncharacterized protein (DUF302 family)